MLVKRTTLNKAVLNHKRCIKLKNYFLSIVFSVHFIFYLLPKSIFYERRCILLLTDFLISSTRYQWVD
jgi:hypothetical protein